MWIIIHLYKLKVLFAHTGQIWFNPRYISIIFFLPGEAMSIHVPAMFCGIFVIFIVSGIFYILFRINRGREIRKRIKKKKTPEAHSGMDTAPGSQVPLIAWQNLKFVFHHLWVCYKYFLFISFSLNTAGCALPYCQKDFGMFCLHRYGLLYVWILSTSVKNPPF